MTGMGDRVDKLVGQWAGERPDLDLETMAQVARVIAVARLMERRIGELAAENGMTPGEGDVLLTLRRAGSPHRLSPSRLSESLLISSGAMTNRLDRLEERGLVRRIPNPDDRRGLDIELTPKARRLVDDLVGEHVAREQRMLEPLSATERRQLEAITRKLLAHLDPGES
jgi:DNA-binding MarR family transcriptional regulator